MRAPALEHRKSAIQRANELAYASGKAREWVAKRDALICAMRADGASLRGIAQHTGLTHPTIARIVRDGTTS